MTSRLVRVLTHLLQNTTAPPSSDSSADSRGLPRVLSCIALHPHLQIVQSGVAQLPGLLAFSVDSRMSVIVDFLREHVVEPLLIGSSGGKLNKDLLQCCCALVTAMPHNTIHGKRLRARVVNDLNLLALCVGYLWRHVPGYSLMQPEETPLE